MPHQCGTVSVRKCVCVCVCIGHIMNTHVNGQIMSFIRPSLICPLIRLIGVLTIFSNFMSCFNSFHLSPVPSPHTDTTLPPTLGNQWLPC